MIFRFALLNTTGIVFSCEKYHRRNSLKQYQRENGSFENVIDERQERRTTFQR